MSEDLRKLPQIVQNKVLRAQRFLQWYVASPRPRLREPELTPVSKDFIAQTGDPTATGTGGESLQSYLHSINQSSGPSPGRYFPPEITNKLKHTARGTVSMAVSPTDPPGCGSQFFITLADKIEYLDGKHAVFGHVIEGFDTLDKINDAFLDKEGRPVQDIRIRHVEILGESSKSILTTSSPDSQRTHSRIPRTSSPFLPPLFAHLTTSRQSALQTPRILYRKYPRNRPSSPADRLPQRLQRSPWR